MATKKDFTQVAHDVFIRATGGALAEVKAPADFTQAALDVVRSATKRRAVKTPARSVKQNQSK